MRRRQFITLLGTSAAAWPSAASAQQNRVVKRLAILIDGTEASARADVAAFQQGLERLGWSEGRNLQPTLRFGDGRADRVRALAPELVKMNPDLIFVAGGTGLAALLQETRTIPIVFFSGDPVAAGTVASQARPGGNATGFFGYEGSFATKWLEVLKEIAPPITRVLALHSGNPTSSEALPAVEQVASTFGVEMLSTRVSDAAEIVLAIETAARAPNVGMMVMPGSLMNSHRDLIAALATRYRLPAIYSNRTFVAAGGLLSYGIDVTDLHRQAAFYVDRILRGEKASDLPVQQATKFEFIVNLKTARALGLNVPTSILLRANEVIE